MFGEIAYVHCDPCNGRGWLLAMRDGWARLCPICEGPGKVSLRSLALQIKEHPSVLHRLAQQRVRAKTGKRLLAKLISFTAELP